MKCPKHSCWVTHEARGLGAFPFQIRLGWSSLFEPGASGSGSEDLTHPTCASSSLVRQPACSDGIVNPGSLWELVGGLLPSVRASPRSELVEGRLGLPFVSAGGEHSLVRG